MRLKRYYRKRPISVGRVRAVRDVLLATLKWELTQTRFTLYYPAEECTIHELSELEEAAKHRGEPKCIHALFRTADRQFLCIETCDPSTITIEVYARDGTPDVILEAVEPILALAPIDEVPQEVTVSSAFLAHAFDDEGTQYANEVARFLTLTNIRTHSGRAFSPESVAQKVQERLAKYDIVIAIISRQEDPTWLIQEAIAAKVFKKPLFILKEDSAEWKAGLLSDFERIPFPSGQISKTFVPILEGLAEIGCHVTAS